MGFEYKSLLAFVYAILLWVGGLNSIASRPLPPIDGLQLPSNGRVPLEFTPVPYDIGTEYLVNAGQGRRLLGVGHWFRHEWCDLWHGADKCRSGGPKGNSGNSGGPKGNSGNSGNIGHQNGHGGGGRHGRE